jgi:transporter family-2 protein
MWGMVISVISGILMSVQGVFNTQVTKATGIWISAAFVQLTAFFTCVAAWFLTGREGQVRQLLEVKPWYMLLGGVMGAFITYTVIAGMDRLGPAKAVMLIVAAQLIAAYLIEVFGLFGVDKTGFDWTKLLGTLLFVAGIFLFKKN